MRWLTIATVFTLAFVPATAGAQVPLGNPPEIDALRQDLDRVRAEVETIKTQLDRLLKSVGQQPQGQTQPELPGGRVRASVANAPVLGRPDAPVTLVEFSDYQCPYCQRFFLTTFPALKKEYIDTGQLRYVFRDFPLDQIHPQARKAAQAAHCAGDQGKYWEMHDHLFLNQRALAPSQLGEHARVLGLDARQFDACLSADRHTAQIEQGLTDGGPIGIRGTPSFVVGRTITGGLVEGTAIRGAQPLENFRRAIDRTLMEP